MALREVKLLEHLLETVLRIEKNIEHRISDVNYRIIQIEKLVQPRPISRFAAVIFTTGDNTMATSALILTVGQTSTATPITYLADGVTPSGATYSAATYTFSDPSATVVLNPDGVTALVTGVAASSGPISGSVSFQAVDTDGAISQWTQAFTIQTNAVVVVPPTQLSQSSGLIFSTPTP